MDFIFFILLYTGFFTLGVITLSILWISIRFGFGYRWSITHGWHRIKDVMKKETVVVDKQQRKQDILDRARKR